MDCNINVYSYITYRVDTHTHKHTVYIYIHAYLYEVGIHNPAWVAARAPPLKKLGLLTIQLND